MREISRRLLYAKQGMERGGVKERKGKGEKKEIQEEERVRGR